MNLGDIWIDLDNQSFGRYCKARDIKLQMHKM